MTGLHLMGFLPEGHDDREASRRAAVEGVEAQPLSTECMGACPVPGLLLDYGGVDEREIRDEVRRLARGLT